MTNDDNDTRTEAMEWAETSEDSRTLAITTALLYVGDMLADVCLEMATGTQEKNEVPPKLAALLAKPAPLAQEAAAAESKVNGRRYDSKGPRHNPADWKKLPDGRWQSPTGRAYQPYTRIAFGVITSRRKLGLPI